MRAKATSQSATRALNDAGGAVDVAALFPIPARGWLVDLLSLWQLARNILIN